MTGNSPQPAVHVPSCKIFFSMWVVVGCLYMLYFTETAISPSLSRRLQRPLSRFSNLSLPYPKSEKGYLHFVLPAAETDLNLCKALVSSFILDYPLPTLIGWNASADSTHLSKISAVNTFLHTFNASSDSDLILMVDSLDTWFQLPASVLLSRYHAINTQARFRPAAAGYNQTIILAAEKKCWPASSENLACAQAPDPALPKTLFGTQTDEQRDLDSINPFQFLRPRYLNSGFLMGEVGHLRELYQRAEEKVHSDGEALKTDQGVLGRVWAEQEFMRAERWARGMVGAPDHELEGSSARIMAANNDTARRRRRKGHQRRAFKEVWSPGSNKSHEFGIGLDYMSALSMTTQWAWGDAEWVTLSNISDIQHAIDELMITDPRVTLGGLPGDMASLALPFDKLNASSGIKGTKWEDMKLYTNLWTGVVPATIHHNGKPDHVNKLLRDSKWGSMWFAGHVRDLLEVRVRELSKMRKDRLLAVDENGKRWYEARKEGQHNAGMEDLKIRTLSQEGDPGHVKWSDLCDENTEMELFDDVYEQVKYLEDH